MRRKRGYSRGSFTPSSVSTSPTTTIAAAAPRITRGCRLSRKCAQPTRPHRTRRPAAAATPTTSTGASSAARSNERFVSQTTSRTTAPTAKDAAATRTLTGPTLAWRYPQNADDPGDELLLGRGLRDRVPRLPVRLQRLRLRAARHRRGRQARPRREQRARRRRDRRSGRARPPRADRRGAERARPLPRPPLGAPVARRRRVARLLAAQARLPRRLAGPPREGRAARGDLGRRQRRLRLPGPSRRPRPARARPGSLLARAAVPPVIPRWLALAVALGVPLLLLFLWRSESRAAYAGVFVVVAILELYGTAIGTWRWTEALPGLGIPDGNPPSGAASGYVCFDVAALLLAPRLLALRTRLPAAAPAQP